MKENKRKERTEEDIKIGLAEFIMKATWFLVRVGWKSTMSYIDALRD